MWILCPHCTSMRIPSLPQRKILVGALLCIIVFVVGIFVWSGKLSYGGSRALLTQALPTSTPDILDIDTDNDGLPDWKERLYGSDITKRDTDGDGTSDAEEVQLGRDPIKPNTAKAKSSPNDKLAYLQDPHFATSSTDILGIKKDFYAKFLAARGDEIKEQTYKDILTKDIDPAALTPKNELVDLNVSSDNSPEAIHTYVNEFGKIIKKYQVATGRSEEVIINEALTKKQPDTLKELQLPAIQYRNFSNDLKELKTPSVIAKYHLLVVNGYDGMSRGILGMQYLFAKPPQGAAGYESYVRYRYDVTMGYAAVVATIKDRDIMFTKDEPGYPFYRIVLLGNAMGTTTLVN